MKKRCSPECKKHYLDSWEELFSPEMLADKLEAFDSIRRSLPSRPRRHVKASETVNDGRHGNVCADTGSSHSIAGERMFQIFKDKGLLFQETTLAMSLADGLQTKDVKNTCWYFWDNPTHKYPFGEELDTPFIVEKMSSNTCQLTLQLDRKDFSAILERLRKWTARIFLPSTEVLLQGKDKEEHPIEFASRLLNPAERNYSTTEREALAVVWALNKFRGYIDGASITVASDHQPLKWLMKLKSLSGRLDRWAL
ncbi:retrovirus-related Pol polyprotein from transposon 297 [Trichonephila clavipes]|nr:retrovirus-related Pol polyprotein from transposon 297 [Trichonephila clavipes]